MCQKPPSIERVKTNAVSRHKWQIDKAELILTSRVKGLSDTLGSIFGSVSNAWHLSFIRFVRFIVPRVEELIVADTASFVAKNHERSNVSGLKPAAELAAKSAKPYPNDSAEYREARTALLVEEIELRRQIERVARQRRKLPLGGAARAYEFLDEQGKTVRLKPRRSMESCSNGSWKACRALPCPMTPTL